MNEPVDDIFADAALFQSVTRRLAGYSAPLFDVVPDRGAPLVPIDTIRRMAENQRRYFDAGDI